ncbi:MAG: hypothetical protein COT74_00265 [Bdellovibrionales bacterium CG10_big_fil_rev_8_21_14_0_10_45_34]|nr:MAG: hypothetical protein COT74_00265 [Bdellovibrionales bacterium CG10_big_fil_rev_8_21_14_0_10_45_34]
MHSLSRNLDRFSKTFSNEPLLESGIIEKLRSGEPVEDSEFDLIFPPYYQRQSAIHWSSIDVARQISEWIRPMDRRSLIDIGCGVGKLCFLLRILTNYEVFGIEQRENFVEIANHIVDVNGFKDISIVQMNMLDLNWSLFDIYYLYNPFQEQIADDESGTIENNIDFAVRNYARYTSEVFRQLAWAKPGKVLITFHGYGGRVPNDWKMVESRHIESGHLTMWIKE